MFNKPMIRRFNWEDGRSHPSSRGLEGWLMKGFETLDPTLGFGVAHDALEHFDATLGADAEMMAFGAILWGRGDSGFKFGPNGVMYALVSDIQGFLEDGMEWCKPIPTRPLRDSEFSKSVWAEDTLSDFRRAMVKGLLEPDGNDNPPRLTDKAEAMLRTDHIVQWMRRGMKRTERRWGRSGGHEAFVSAFHQLKDDRNVQSSNHEMGDVLIVRIMPDGRGVDTRIWNTYYGDQ